MDNIFDKIKPCLFEIKKASRYIGGEFNAPIIDANSDNFNFCMCYPDIYDIGQSNQAVKILCNKINEIDGFAAQRSYLPDPDAQKVFENNGISMFSLESFSPLCQFDAIGITVSHDLLATNILELLHFAKIPIRSKDRNNQHPFIFGGGPMYCNPEPYHAFFDIITIGEGEIATINCIKELKRLKDKGLSRQDILHKLSVMDSIYVPSMYKIKNNEHLVQTVFDDVPKKIKKAVYKDFHSSSAYDNCIVPFTELVHNRVNVEILRGCARSCRFCQAGVMYRPVRERSKENICAAVKEGILNTGYDEVSLTSLSSTDHSQIKEILQDLNDYTQGKGLRVSLPSQRLDSFGLDMAKLVAGEKKGGLTFAIEAGTQRLRDVINKNVTEDNIFSSIKYAFENGWNRAKLYFMIGLPTETDKDIIAIASLCEKILECAKESAGKKRSHNVNISVSCSIFVPKAQTPFMWDGQITFEESKRKIDLIRQNIKSRAISFGWHDPKSSFIEAVLSRGGRECSNLIEQAWKCGSKFDAWKEYFNFEAWLEAAKKCSINMEILACQNYEIGQQMPWEHISLGVDKSYFIKERNLALEEKTTQDCTFESCNNCGACKNLGIGNKICKAKK